MTHRTRTALAALTLTAAGFGLTAPAQAAGTACTGTEGVTVVVGDALACAQGDPTTALEALKSAGHEVTPVSTFPGAICQIDGKPAGADCTKMPAADAFWGFYTADAGKDWGFAPKGANEVDPAPGSAIGFSFGKGDAKPAAAFAPASATSSATSATPSASATTTATDEADDEQGTSIWKWLLPLLALALIGGLIAALMRRRTPERTEAVVTERYVPDTDRDVRVREDLRGTDVREVRDTDVREVREGDVREGDLRDGDLDGPRDDRSL
ncbi:MAG: hypothetical protein LWW86_16380 [Micrococcales bacterium]|nr:hypothetical protein [Micrococcales bacterium]